MHFSRGKVQINMPSFEGQWNQVQFHITIFINLRGIFCIFTWYNHGTIPTALGTIYRPSKHSLLPVYRVTRQLVQNLPLTLIWSCLFGIRTLYTAFCLYGSRIYGFFGYMGHFWVAPNRFFYNKIRWLYGFLPIWCILEGQNRGPYIRNAVY